MSNFAKNYEDWSDEESFYDFVKPNDFIDERIFTHCLATMAMPIIRGNIIQNSKAYAMVGGKNVYQTFAKEQGQWRYLGLCFAQEKVNRLHFDYLKKDGIKPKELAYV